MRYWACFLISKVGQALGPASRGAEGLRGPVECKALKPVTAVGECSRGLPGLTPPPVPPADKVNRESVRSIQKSIFTVCLDAPVPRVSEDVYRSQVAGQMLHGGGSKLNSGNRWFDKTLQVRACQGLASHPDTPPHGPCSLGTSCPSPGRPWTASL